jgi:predicted dehydrogenase
VILRAALVGCGLIGSEFADDPLVEGVHSHAGAYAESALTSLVAVCDVDPDKVRRCGERWGVAAQYQDCGRMLAEQKPDLVSVCTPDQTHHDVLKTVLAAPSVRGVLAEKPLALTIAQAQEIARLASERGVTLAVNYSRRYANSHRKLKTFLESGGIGEVQTVGGYYTKGALHNGTHWFDLARFLVGDIARVWGRDVLREGGRDPTLDAFMEFESGAAAHLQACRAAAYAVFEMDLIGTRGRVQLVDSGHVFHTFEVADSPRYSGYRALVPVAGVAGGLENVLLHAVEDLARSVDAGTQPLCSAADGIAALKVALAVRDSARSGVLIELRDVG